MTATESAPTPVNIGTERELIRKIASQLTGRLLANMTKSERNILRLLTIHNYIEVCPGGESVRLSDKK